MWVLILHAVSSTLTVLSHVILQVFTVAEKNVFFMLINFTWHLIAIFYRFFPFFFFYRFNHGTAESEWHNS